LQSSEMVQFVEDLLDLVSSVLLLLGWGGKFACLGGVVVFA
jgi:hypothetical protein